MRVFNRESVVNEDSLDSEQDKKLPLISEALMILTKKIKLIHVTSITQKIGCLQYRIKVG